MIESWVIFIKDFFEFFVREVKKNTREDVEDEAYDKNGEIKFYICCVIYETCAVLRKR